MPEIVLEKESYLIMGACFEVYKEMGCGFLESVYQECLEKELSRQDIPFQPQVGLGLSYKGQRLLQKYIPDFICYQQVILEIKAVSMLANEHRAQIHNYLKASGCRLGLLVILVTLPKLNMRELFDKCK